jgi:hypothetical protein
MYIIIEVFIMPSNQAELKETPSPEISEIEKLESLMENSLLRIHELQTELKDLENDLNNFLDLRYGSGATFFQSSTSSTNVDNNNSQEKLDQARTELYNKIAKICSQDEFSLSESNAHEDLLKIEGYLSEGTDSSQAPHNLLSDLTCEYYNLMQQMLELKSNKQNLLENSTYDLKQEIMWVNVKTTETISRIKDDITHQVNRPS